MPSIAEIRQKYPQYEDLSDQQLADALHRRFYSDMPREQFDAKIAVAQPVPQHSAAAPIADGPSPAQPPAPENPLRAGVQGAGRSLADLAGFAPDVVNMGANTALAGVDAAARALGGSVSFRFPMVSDKIAQTGADIAGLFGGGAMDPDAMSAREKMAYNVNRFGGQAVLGGAGLARAAARRAPELAAPDAGPKMFDNLLRPYLERPGKALVGDTAAGASAGAALTGSQELIPEDARKVGGGTVGTLADFVAMLTGAVSAGTAMEAVTRTPLAVVREVRGAMPARGVALDPETKLPITNSVADAAARHVQGQAIDPAEAAAAIRRNVAEFDAEGLPIPTTGLISEDTGLAALERGNRVRQSTGSVLTDPKTDPREKARYSFGERDTALRDKAVEEVQSLRPDGADPEAFVQRAGDVRQARIDASRRVADRAGGRERAVQTARETEAANLRANEGQGAAASANIDETYRNTRAAELQRNRDLYNDPELTAAQVPEAPMTGVADRLHAADDARAPLDPVVRKYVDRFRTADIDPDAPPVDAPPPFTMEMANRNIAELEKDIADNLANGAVVRQLREFKTTAQRYADTLADEGNPAAQAATQNYAQRVAPNFREGAGGKLDERLKSDRSGYSTRPSDTAETFLTRPEDAADLMRIAQLGGNEAQTAANARTWLLDKLARTGVIKGDVIDPERLARWRNVNQGILDEVPGLGAEVNQMVRQAQRGERLADAATREVGVAQRQVADTVQEVDRGPLGMVAGKSPDKAVASVFASGNPRAAMRELRTTVGRNPDAERGLRAAVADFFEARVSSVNPANVSEGNTQVGFARLVKEFDKNADVLAEVYSPEQMNALRRAQRVLEPLTQRSGQATTGSITAENSEMVWRSLRLGLYAYYGSHLKAGGAAARLKDIAKTVFGGGEVEQANRLVARMLFDPELAAHLLTRKVADVGTPAWNSRLQKIIRRTEVGKEVLSPEKDE